MSQTIASAETSTTPEMTSEASSAPAPGARAGGSLRAAARRGAAYLARWRDHRLCPAGDGSRDLCLSPRDLARIDGREDACTALHQRTERQPAALVAGWETHLAFLRAPGHRSKASQCAEERERGVGQPQICLIPMDGGEARQLTWLTLWRGRTGLVAGWQVHRVQARRWASPTMQRWTTRRWRDVTCRVCARLTGSGIKPG